MPKKPNKPKWKQPSEPKNVGKRSHGASHKHLPNKPLGWSWNGVVFGGIQSTVSEIRIYIDYVDLNITFLKRKCTWVKNLTNWKIGVQSSKQKFSIHVCISTKKLCIIQRGHTERNLAWKWISRKLLNKQECPWLPYGNKWQTRCMEQDTDPVDHINPKCWQKVY